MQHSRLVIFFMGILSSIFFCVNHTVYAADFNGTDNAVNDMAEQFDGKIVIVGGFRTYNDIDANWVVRIQPNGSLDNTFTPVLSPYATSISEVAIQENGKIIIGGYGFDEIDGVAKESIARLNADGSLDTGFISDFNSGAEVKSITIQNDNKVIVTGNFFEQYDGYDLNGSDIIRINDDGTLDTSFNAGIGADYYDIDAVAIQSDGKILIGGGFTSFNGTNNINRIARLHSDGTLDTSFDIGTGADSNVHDIKIQPDGKIIIAGNFSYYNDVYRSRIARLNADGILDTNFDPGDGASDTNLISRVLLQTDGKMMIGGSFITYDGVNRKRIARLGADGSLDIGFDPGDGFYKYVWPSNDWAYVHDIVLLSGEKILVGGAFDSYDNNSSPNIVLLDTAGNINESFGDTASVETQSVLFASDSASSAYGDLITSIDESTQRYIQWGVSSGNYTHSCAAGTGGIGVYSCQMTGLITNQIYYIRAYVIDYSGTYYGDEIEYTHFASLTETIIPNEFIGGGTAQGWQGDEETWSYQLPFDFSFYGTTYPAGTSIGITSNGQICLEDDTNCADYENDISSATHGPFIAPLWTDFDSTNAGDIYITENTDYVIIRWETEEYDIPGKTINFEAILYNDGNIKFNYGAQDAPLQNFTATVGISNGDGSYVESVYDGLIDFNNVDTSAWGDFTINMVSQSPANNATDVPVDFNLIISFDRPVEPGTGNIIIHKKDDDSVIEIIDINTPNVIGWSSDTLTINPTNNLPANTAIYINIEAGALVDSLADPFSGISDAITWTFTTQAEELITSEEPIVPEESVVEEAEEIKNDLSVEIINIKNIKKDSLDLRVEIEGNYEKDDKFDFKVKIKNKKTGKKQKIKLKKVKVSDAYRATLEISQLLPDTFYSISVSVSKTGKNDYSKVSDSKSIITLKDLEEVQNTLEEKQPPVVGNSEEIIIIDEEENREEERGPESEEVPAIMVNSSEENNKNIEEKDENISVLVITPIVVMGLIPALINAFSTAAIPFIPLTPRVLRAPLLLRIFTSSRRKLLSVLKFFPILTISANEKNSIPFDRKESNKFWGVVFDSYTKQPIKDAVVYLVNLDKKRVVEYVITDEQGRYGFLIGETGKYALEVKKGIYQIVTSNQSDILYQNVYTQPINFISGDLFNINVALTAPNFNWDKFSQDVIKKYNSIFFKSLSYLLDAIYLAGIILSIYNVIYYPNLFNYLALAFYLSLLIYRLVFKDKKKFGVVSKKETGSPVPFTVVALYDIVNRQRLNFAITDVLGRYYLLAKNGSYALKLKYIDMTGGSYEKDGMANVEKGIFKKDFEV